MASEVAKGTVTLTVDTPAVEKEVEGLGGKLAGRFASLGEKAGSMIGGRMGAAVTKVTSTGKGGLLAGTAVGVAAGGVIIGKSLYDLGKEFDDSYRQIRRSTGATGDDFKALQGTFKDVARQSGSSFGDITTAVSGLSVKTGASGKDLETLSLSMLRLASVTGVDLNKIIDSSATMFARWGVTVGEQPLAMDKLLVVSQKTGIGVDTLAGNMTSFGPVLKGFGLGFDTSAMMLGGFDKAGVNTGQAMQGLKRYMSDLSKTGEKDLPGALARSVKAIGEAGSVSEANGIAVKLFGARAGPEMAAAIAAGTLSVDDLVGSLDGAEGTIKNTARETATAGGKFNLFKNQVKVALEPVAMALFDTLTEAFFKLTPHLKKGAELLGAFAKFVADNMDIVGPLAAVVGVLVGAFLTMLAVNKVVGVVKAFTGAMKLLNASFLTNPVFLVVAAIAALVVGVVIAYKKVDWFRDAVDTVGRAIRDAAKWVLDLAKKIPELVSAFTGWAPIQAIVDTLKGTIRGLWDVISGMVDVVVGLFTGDWDRAWSGAKKIVSGFLDYFLTIPRLLLNVLKSLGVDLLGGITSAFGAVLDFFAGLPGKILGLLSGAGSWLADVGTKILAGLLAGIEAGAKAVWFFYVQLPIKIAGYLAGAASWLVNAGVKLLGGLAAGIGAGAAAVWGFMAGLPARLLGYVSSTGAWLVGAGRNLLNGMFNGITTGATAVWTFFIGLPARIKGYLSGAVGWLTETGAAIIRGLVNAITGALGTVAGALGKIKGNVTGAVAGAASWLLDAGKDIIRGLIDGIGSMAGAVADKVKGVATGAVGAIKGALKIGSPSKVFFGLGADTGQGFVLGLEALAPAVNAAMAALTEPPPVGSTGGDWTRPGATAGVGSADTGRAGTALNIENANFYDGTDVELVMRKAEFAVTAGRI